jgi:hypothetical protein
VDSSLTTEDVTVAHGPEKSARPRRGGRLHRDGDCRCETEQASCRGSDGLKAVALSNGGARFWTGADLHPHGRHHAIHSQCEGQELDDTMARPVIHAELQGHAVETEEVATKLTWRRRGRSRGRSGEGEGRHHCSHPGQHSQPSLVHGSLHVGRSGSMRDMAGEWSVWKRERESRECE